MTTKRCAKCIEHKPADKFYTHPKSADGLFAKCKECVKAETRQRNKSNRQKLDAYGLVAGEQTHGGSRGARKNIKGYVFGSLTVVGLSQQRPTLWKCRCDCGDIRIVSDKNLRSGMTRACKACAKIVIALRLRVDVSGQRYGMLVALYVEKITNQGIHWKFRCDCGGLATLRLKDVRNGNSLSCGCKQYKPGAVIDAVRPWRRNELASVQTQQCQEMP